MRHGRGAHNLGTGEAAPAGSGRGGLAVVKTFPKFVHATLAAVSMAMLGLMTVSCAGAAPTATATTEPTPVPTATSVPTATPIPTPTPVPSPTPDPELAPYLAAIEAGDAGPIPKGSFVGYKADGRTGNSARLALDSEGRVTLAGFPGRYTSTEDTLVVVGLQAEFCGQMPGIYSWALVDGKIVITVIKDSCGGRGGEISEHTWQRPF